MPTEISRRIAAMAKRCESTALLCGMLAGQAERQRKELEELRTALEAKPLTPEPTLREANEISAEMLDG